MKPSIKHVCIAAALAAASLSTWAQPNVGVSVNINQPGLYGRIDIGNVGVAPELIYGQPVVIAPSRVATYQRPIYLHVPLGYERNWGRYCAQYGACGQPVYFVREDWYQQHYRHDRRDFRPMPVRENGREFDRDHGRGPDRDHGPRRDGDGRGDNGNHGDRGNHGDHGNHGDRGDHGDQGDHGRRG